MGGKIPNSVEEEARVIEAAKKDHKHFAPLYDKYFRQIFLFVLKRVADESLASDLTSQVFLKAMLKLPSYRHMGYPFSAWLYRIAINEVNMHYRKSKKHQVVEVKESDVAVMMGEIEIGAEGDDDLTLVLSALAELPEEQQRLVELRFFEKCSFKEIGEILEISEGNAKIRTYRALDKIKQAVSKG